jgi:hypothetical protein
MTTHHRSQPAPKREFVDCDVAGVGVDLNAIDALAYAALTARRLGCRIVLRQASPQLQEVIRLVGLSAVLPCATASIVEPRRQAEEREDPRGVEEERDPADPTA